MQQKNTQYSAKQNPNPTPRLAEVLDPTKCVLFVILYTLLNPQFQTELTRFNLVVSKYSRS